MSSTEIPASVMRSRDLFGQALASMLSRPARSALTVLGVVLGVGAFVAVLGLTTTASGQISKRFTALAATEVLAKQASTLDGAKGNQFPPDADLRVERITGVRAAGLSWTVGFKTKPSVSGVKAPGQTPDTTTPVVAASPGLLRVVHPTFAQGQTFEDVHNDRADRVAVLGSSAARRLGITDLTGYPAIFLDDVPFTAIGVLDNVQRQPQLLASVLIPRRTAEGLWGATNSEQPPELLVDTELGAAAIVATQVPVALRPDAPQAFAMVVPPDPHTLHDHVDNDLGTLVLVLATVSLVIGAVGIANTMTIAILERRKEIGLRRALGARPRHIAAQMVTESTFLGLTGGLLGTGAGMTCILLVAITNNWTPIIPTWAPALGPAAGVMLGLLAGCYPALRATQVEPVTALN